jgi:hypothetical protein
MGPLVDRRSSRPGRPAASRSRGQMLVVFSLCLTVVVLVVGLVVDGGYALVQRRSSQNSADFAALAGARIVAEWIAGNTTDGTDSNVKAAIIASNSVNGGANLTFGTSGSPVYVATDGTVLGYVGAGSIPAGSVGVQVSSNRSWSPFFLRVVGMTSWSAGATATARGGYYDGGPPGGVFPAGIAEAFFDGRVPCVGNVSGSDNSPCYPQRLTPGNLNVPGGFGWLKFGCSGYGLGQVSPANTGGCATSLGFLQTEIGPPSNAFGCCSAIGLSGSPDQIGSLPGIKTSADCSYWIATNAMVTVPVWDVAGGSGSNAWYHIVGYTGFQITGCDGGKDLEGVWRQPFYVGPTTTVPGFAGAPLAVQLVH